MLISQRDDHRHNFFRTRDLSNVLASVIDQGQLMSGFGPSLLRFYAAESGLKFLLNRTEKVPFEYEVADQNLPLDSVASFPGRIEGYSHDLPRMLSRLKVSAATVNVPAGPFKVVKGYKNGQQFDLKGAHEAWRYGLEVDAGDQVQLEGFLTGVIAYVEAEI
ncbi:hypothetical protein [Pseudomonas fluorescens]|jgi:hypothetical protein|uniref:hypothetical protein n=1 Tax=Pseudomonas fluorescens TaxID=294 RepID=UPI00124036FE|nr:hypothetical protein [Pseudomonas fluorescens]